MGNHRELTALPSKVILPDGDTVTLDEMVDEEKKKIWSQICCNVSNELSIYYSSHPTEWAVFLGVMS